MELSELIQQLSEIAAPSGFEEPAARVIESLLSPFCDSVHTDVMGNVTAVKKCGKAGAKRLLLDAHMDEVGLIITGQEKGFLRFSFLGGVDRRMLPARRVKLLTDPPRWGVIDTMPPHVLTADEQDKAIEPDKLFIDAGLKEEEAEKLVPPGTPAVFDASCERLGPARLCGKALDDRACAAILIKVMEQLAGRDLSVDVCCLISTQEEVGCRGAQTGAYAARPDLAVAVDVTHGWTPDAKKEETMTMGVGAAIGVGPGMTKKISDLMIKLSQDREIPYQIEVLSGHTGTNSWVIQTLREGVATGLVSLPLRYMHSPAEVIDLRDCEAVVRLLCEFACSAEEVL